MTEFEQQLTAFVDETHERINAFRQAARSHSYACPSSGVRMMASLMELQKALRQVAHDGKAVCYDVERHEDPEPSGQKEMVL